MKFTSFLLSLLASLSALAQLPTNPKDISPLLIGEKVTTLELADAKGEGVQLSELFSQGPSIVVFYRGGWCPYCTKHLSSLAENEQQILDLGYQIIAIAPQGPGDIDVTGGEYGINYHLLSDSKGELMSQMGIAFKPNEKTLAYMTKNSTGKTEEILPVPAVFVIDKEGTILFEHINPDYSKRMETKYLINVLEGLK